MTQIYVVCKQIRNNIGMPSLCPDQAFQDYPTAIAYAEKIFTKDMFNPSVNPRDLVYLLNVVASTTVASTDGMPTVAIPASTTTATVPAIKSTTS